VNSIVLVRHGETEWSLSGQHTGRTDIPLLDAGRAAARAVRPVLAQRSFALVLTSPLARAKETCELAGLGDVAQDEPDLMEWDYGDMEGRTTPQIRETHPGWDIWADGVTGGESADDVGARVDRVIARAEAADGDVALFAHGHVLRILAARWIEQDPRLGGRLTLATAAMCELGHEHERRVIERWNDTHHLPG
jgi:broad specificity phosphatase PhoE